MNKIEIVALEWLSRFTGFSKDDIKFSNNSSPDFLTPDGQGFEVKRCWGYHGNYFTIYNRQWQYLLEHPNCRILLFSDKNLPDAIIPLSELPIGINRWGIYKVYSYENNIGAMTRKEYLKTK